MFYPTLLTRMRMPIRHTLILAHITLAIFQKTRRTVIRTATRISMKMARAIYVRKHTLTSRVLWAFALVIRHSRLEVFLRGTKSRKLA